MTERLCKNCIWFLPLDIKRIIEEGIEKEDKRRRICSGLSIFNKRVMPFSSTRCVNPKEYKEAKKWN